MVINNGTIHIHGKDICGNDTVSGQASVAGTIFESAGVSSLIISDYGSILEFNSAVCTLENARVEIGGTINFNNTSLSQNKVTYVVGNHGYGSIYIDGSPITFW